MRLIAMFALGLVLTVSAIGLGDTVISPALALEPEERLDDPDLEARARGLSAELRCVVCQNQSIDESNATLASDMRRLVRQRLTAGDSDEEVKQYLVDRYGDYVLLRPPVSQSTLILWGAPAAIVLVGAAALLLMARNRTQAVPAAPLSDEERKKIASILADRPQTKRAGMDGD